ncbi:hypothetical protein HYDPIDRAFT_95128 [Hydnomerulius pinastri MD-312]|uniref:Uncharacterized protein n=1 Tax=Hydnomerulius pinastri MD-312 TaxID=994086 RepID=A0A0C9V8P5_9AGAM|nr:hypothetical protein HYDPIDRAFT_95128 [Hydnomerulius pinastri MD-312]
MENPHNVVPLNFAENEHAEARLVFTNLGKIDAEAAQSLAALWTIKNNQEKAAWDLRVEAEALIAQEARQLVAEEAEQRRRTVADEQELAKQEEQKKYKNKFTPIPDVAIPTETIFISPAHVSAKLRKSEFVALYYFTNHGFVDAKDSTPSVDDDTLAIIQTEGGIPTFQTAASVKAKGCHVPDGSLSWEEFSEANHRMLAAMQDHDWVEDCIASFTTFWLALEAHHWRHDPCEFGK